MYAESASGFNENNSLKNLAKLTKYAGTSKKIFALTFDSMKYFLCNVC